MREKGKTKPPISEYNEAGQPEPATNRKKREIARQVQKDGAAWNLHVEVEERRGGGR